MSLNPSPPDQQLIDDDETLHDEIAAAAFSLFLRKGARAGDDVQNWLDAEASVRARRASTVFLRPGPSPAAQPVH